MKAMAAMATAMCGFPRIAKTKLRTRPLAGVMAMSGIGGVGFVRLLRRMRTETLGRERAPGKSGKPGKAESGKSALRTDLAARLAGIDVQGADAEVRAVELFIESVLVREFGEAVLSGASGRELLHRMRDAMMAAPEVREALLAMLAALAARDGGVR
jgi:hypothetical protein